LDLHLLELAGAEDEVARSDLVAEGLADLPDAEGQLAPHGLGYVVEVDEDALRRLRPQIGEGGVLLHRAHEGLEHEVELAGRGEGTPAAGGAEGAPPAAGRARRARRGGGLGSPWSPRSSAPTASRPPCRHGSDGGTRGSRPWDR